MRFRFGFLCWLCLFVGGFPALAYNYTVTVTQTGTSGATEHWAVGVSGSGGSCGSISYAGGISGAFTGNGTFTINWSDAVNSALYIEVKALCPSSGTYQVVGTCGLYSSPGGPADTFDFTSCVGTGILPYTNTFIHVQWTNTQAGHWAAPMLFYTDNSGHQYADTGDFSGVAVAPGGIIDEWLTNSASTIGFIPSNFIFGDQRTGATSPDQNGSVGTYGSTGVGSGNGGNTGGYTGQTPGQATAGSTQYGNTNLTGNQFAQGVSAITMASAANETALRDIQGGTNGSLSNVVNGQSTGNALLGAGTNLQAMGNLLLGTNAGRLGALTNYASMGTNLQGIGNSIASAGTGLLATISGELGTGNGYLNAISNQLSGNSNVFVMNLSSNSVEAIRTNGNLLNSIQQWLSNYQWSVRNDSSNRFAAWGFTNGFDESTNAGSMWGQGSNLLARAGGITNGTDSFDARPGLATGYGRVVSGLGTVPGSTFGILGLGDGSSIDLKEMLNGNSLETPFSGSSIPYTAPGGGHLAWTGVGGIRGVIRLFILWSVVVGMILLYAQEIRERMLEVLHVPAIPVTPIMIAGNSVGPVQTTPMRIGLMILLVSTLFFIPSIITAAAATVFAFLPSDVSTFVGANGIDMITAYNTVFSAVFALLDSWLPIHEGLIFAINYVIATWSVNSACLLLGTWKAGYGG